MWLMFVASVMLGALPGCNGERLSDSEAGGSYERPLQLEIHLDPGNVELSTVQLQLEYDAERLELHQLTSLLPPTMRLEYDRAHLGRGRFRLLCLPREPGEAVQVAAEPSMRVARLQLSARDRAMVPRSEWVRVSSFQAFGPLPDQPEVTQEVEINLVRIRP